MITKDSFKIGRATQFGADWPAVFWFPDLRLKTLLNFGEMQFVARHDFPDELAAIVTHHVIKCNNSLSISANLSQGILDDADLHPGAKEAIEVYLSNK